MTTILAIAWWNWIFIALGALVALLWLSLRNYRRSVRKHVIRYLNEAHPDVKIISESSAHLIISCEQAEQAQLNLHNLYARIAEAKTKTTDEERAIIIKEFVSGLFENLERASRPMNLESDGDFLLPRLMNEADFKNLCANGKVASRSLDGTGLFVVYVRDSEAAVSYLHESALAELRLDIPALHERALANLRRKSAPDFARKVLEQNALNVLKLGDTFDAARLLLIPEQLKPGETVAAVIPDRDTLAVAPPPQDGDWSRFAKLSAVTDGPALLNRALKVTEAGFELVGRS